VWLQPGTADEEVFEFLMNEGKELEVKTIYTASDVWAKKKRGENTSGPPCEGGSHTQPDVISDLYLRMK
jgi:hypothetical protein